MHSGCRREGAGLCFSAVPAHPAALRPQHGARAAPAQQDPGRCWGCSRGSGGVPQCPARTADPGSGSMTRPEDLDTSAADACRNAAVIHFLCSGVRVGSVCGCCTAVQAAVPASLASPIGLWHIFFLSLVYCVL